MKFGIIELKLIFFVYGHLVFGCGGVYALVILVLLHEVKSCGLLPVVQDINQYFYFQIFSPYGVVEDVYLMRDEMKQSRGMLFKFI